MISSRSCAVDTLLAQSCLNTCRAWLPGTRQDVCKLNLPCTPCYAGHLPALDNKAKKHQTLGSEVGQKIERTIGNVEALRESTRIQILILKLEC